MSSPRIIHCHGCDHVVLQQFQFECPNCGHVNSPDNAVIDTFRTSSSADDAGDFICVKCEKEPAVWTFAAAQEYERRAS